MPKSYAVISVLVGTVLATGGILRSTSVAAETVTKNAVVTVTSACSMEGTIVSGDEHTATLENGTYSAASGSEYENGIGKTTLKTLCNDENGFAIYAVGYTGNVEGTTTLVGANTGLTINTGVYTSSDTASSWSMKVTKVTDSTTAYNPANMSITNSFNDWHTVPSTYTKVAQYKAQTGSSATDATLGAKVETTYAAYISSSQAADTYSGQVKYVLVHPYNGAAPTL